MRMTKRFPFWVGILGAVWLCASGIAQVKIAVIDMQKVFDGYWKTKQSQKVVEQRKNEFDQRRQELLEQYQKALQEYRKLDESARDPAISPEEQQRRRQQAERKLAEVRGIEQNIRQMTQTFQTSLQEQIQRMRDQIIQEIKDVVDQKARAAGYNLVLDTAAVSGNRTPIILFCNGVPDLTQEVLRQLNQSAPPGVLDQKTAGK